MAALLRAVMGGLTSAMLTYFHLPQIFRQPEGKSGEREREGEDDDDDAGLDFFLVKTLNLFHLASQFDGVPGPLNL